MRAFLISGLLLLSQAGQGGSGAVGTVFRVFDGDTVEVRLDTGVVRVRLHAIDTPDMEQPFYDDATDALTALIGEGQVELAPVSQDYGRIVAVMFADGKDLNAAMIRNGFAYAYRKYLGMVEIDDGYCALEHEARTAKRGLWALAAEERIAPWQMRQYRRGERTAFTDFGTETFADCRTASGQADSGPGTIAFAPTPGLTPPDPDCPIKGDISYSGRRVYRLPGDRNYRHTFIDEQAGERWFCTEEEARAAGWQSSAGPP